MTAKKLTNRFAIICKYENMERRISERHPTYKQASNALKDFHDRADYRIVDLASTTDPEAERVRFHNGIKLPGEAT